MLLVASFALLGLWRLARVANSQVAIATFSALRYPVFFSQSSLAQLDMMAAAFTLWGLAMYVERRIVAAVIMLALAPLAKETALITPLAICAWELLCPLMPASTLAGEPLCLRSGKPIRALLWLLCAIPLACWLAYHKHATGYLFGNPEYLRYNATATLNPLRIVLAMLIRLWHLLGYLNLFTHPRRGLCNDGPLCEPDGKSRPRIPVNVQLVSW